MTVRILGVAKLRTALAQSAYQEMPYHPSHHLSLDTNTWIYLANGTEPVKLLRFIHQEMELSNLEILLPELVLQEWHKNKKDAVEKGVLKHLSDLNGALDRVLHLVGDKNKSNKDLYYLFFDDEYQIEEEAEQESELIREVVLKFKEKRKLIENAVARNIKLIEKIFANAVIIKASDAVRLKSSEFALAKKAPFAKKNSFADAVILFSFIEYVENRGIADAIFVSYNIEDFCKRENGRISLHPDLTQEFVRSGSYFYHVLGEAVNQIQDNLMSLEEIEAVEELKHQFYEEDEEEPIEFCEHCLKKDLVHHSIEFEPRQPLHDERVSAISGNQLLLNFVRYFAKKPGFEVMHSILAGFCTYCEKEHFKCASCGSLNIVDEDDYDYRFECSTCRIPYYIDTKDIEAEIKPYHMRESYVNLARYRILKNRILCEKCGRDYTNCGPGITLCEQCEEEEIYQDIMSPSE